MRCLGVFENYLNVPFKDCDMLNIVHGLDWFCHFDTLNKEILHSQNYSIMGHLHFPIVASHFLFSSTKKPRVSFPTQMTELRNRMTQATNVVGRDWTKENNRQNSCHMMKEYVDRKKKLPLYKPSSFCRNAIVNNKVTVGEIECSFLVGIHFFSA